jgi:hypothetical protein
MPGDNDAIETDACVLYHVFLRKVLVFFNIPARVRFIRTQFVCNGADW